MLLPVRDLWLSGKTVLGLFSRHTWITVLLCSLHVVNEVDVLEVLLITTQTMAHWHKGIVLQMKLCVVWEGAGKHIHTCCECSVYFPPECGCVGCSIGRSLLGNVACESMCWCLA